MKLQSTVDIHISHCTRWWDGTWRLWFPWRKLCIWLPDRKSPKSWSRYAIIHEELAKLCGSDCIWDDTYDNDTFTRKKDQKYKFREYYCKWMREVEKSILKCALSAKWCEFLNAVHTIRHSISWSQRKTMARLGLSTMPWSTIIWQRSWSTRLPNAISRKFL